MAITEQTIGLQPSGRRALESVLPASSGWRGPLLALSLLLGLTGRIGYSWNAPFWFDETFSGVIASQPSVRQLVEWCLTELTGPAFYMPLWAWEKIAGPSDMALRLPSLILSIAGPLLILWKGHRNRDVRLWWAVFALLWVPMFALAGEARPYPQLFVLGVMQSVLFVRLLEGPSIMRASGWLAVSSLLILTHYWAALPCLVEGLAYLAYQRWRAVSTWPAVLVLVPMLGWLYLHLPMVLGFAVVHDAAYAGWPLSALPEIPGLIFGVTFAGTIVLAAVVVSVVLARVRGDLMRSSLSPEHVLALCGVVSIIAALTLAFARPGFAPRYMTPAMPAFLFGLALWARWTMTRDIKPLIAVTVIMLTTASGLIGSMARDSDHDSRHLFNFERPSAWLAERHPKHLVVFWDGPIGAVSSTEHLDQIGGFFLRRDGHQITVDVARASPVQNPNLAVLALAKAPDSAILWTANDLLPGTRTPRVPRYDTRFECRDFGEGQLTMTACRQRR